MLLYELPALGADGVVGVVVDLAALDNGHLLIEEVYEGAGHAGLGLAPLAQEDDVLAGEDGVLDLGDDGIVIADDTREYGLVVAQFLDKVLAHLFFDREHLVLALLKLAEGSWPGRFGLVSGHEAGFLLSS